VALKEKFIPAARIESGNEVGVAPVEGIAQAMGKEILRLPGGHLDLMSDRRLGPVACCRYLVKNRQQSIHPIHMKLADRIERSLAHDQF